MKRISKISIKNYRAYFDSIEIRLPKGENLLIYGENGSGKSSLYKGIGSFINSFIQQTPYESNRYQTRPEGCVTIGFRPYNDALQDFDGEEVLYTFQEGVDNTHIPDSAFLKSAAVTKGFLDYKDLMRVYLHDTTDGNLFDLIVNSILRDYLFNNVRLSVAWKNIEQSFWNAKKNTKKSHQRAVHEIDNLRVWLQGVFDKIEPIINHYLTTYFGLSDITVSFDIERLNAIDQGGKSQWRIFKTIKLKVHSNGDAIDKFEDFLNEAKLSAISICIFLAALKSSESSLYKILFMDDVFVGLDAGNRKPILRILKDHFSDYQLIISTYDRYWYNTAGHFFKVEMPKRWLKIALYSGNKKLEDINKDILCPILVVQDSALEKAHAYLHDRENPDYPAAANYFRKYLEEVLERYFPRQEFTEDEYQLMERYELTNRMDRARRFLQNVHSTYTGLNVIDTYLHALLHPMSHYNEEDQVYHSELLEVERIARGLDSELKDLKSRYLCVFDKGAKIFITYHNADNTYSCEYTLVLKENAYLYKNEANQFVISDCECECKQAKEKVNGVENRGSYPHSYSSILSAKQEILEYLNNVEQRAVIVEPDYDGIYYLKEKQRLKISDEIAAKSVHL